MNICTTTKSSPVLLDRMIQALQTAFLEQFTWLSYAFGRSYRLIKTVEDREYAYPAIYMSNSEYLSVLPNDELGNFAFFEIDDPQEFDGILQGKAGLKVKGAIIFWYSLNSIYADADVHYGEDVKNEILQFLNTKGILSSGRITLLRVYDKAENIYKGYSLKQVDNQYLMHPYAGVRIECEFKINELC